MRVLLFFDLPVESASDRRAYNKFRKSLINDGFMMMQKSVYVKLLLNNTDVKTIKNRINKYKPKKGLIQILTITEKQFNSIELVIGENHKQDIDSTERLVIL